MELFNRRDCLKIATGGLGALVTPFASAAPGSPAEEEYTSHHDHVIGTSLDLYVVAPGEKIAEDAEGVVLAEIERLRRILSVFDPASELSRVNASRGTHAISPELFQVLSRYEHWYRRTGGAFAGHVGELTRVWKEAEEADELPPGRLLDRIATDLLTPSWHLDPVARTVRRTTDQPLNCNAIGKIFIAEAAVAAVQRSIPGVSGILMNLGGDVVACGSPPGGNGWVVGIQSPFRHYDNAAPFTAVRLKNQAIASSGDYQRSYSIRGRRYSHIFDPRTGRPAGQIAGATVVAADGVTANALATAFCVMAPEESLKLSASIPGVDCLLFTRDGRQFRTPGFRLLPVEPSRPLVPVGSTLADAAWPEGYQVTVALELPKLDAKRYRKPYVAVWVEDSKGKAVRTLGVWGNAPKYLKDLSDWWKVGKNDSDLVKAVAKATRGPGKYDLVWDGKDDKGNPLPQGTYTVRVEVHREFGSHLRQSGKIECKDRAASTKLEKNAETGETVVEFKKMDKKK